MVVSAVDQWIHYGSCCPCDRSPAAFTDGHLHSQTQRCLCCVLGENKHCVFISVFISDVKCTYLCPPDVFKHCDWNQESVTGDTGSVPCLPGDTCWWKDGEFTLEHSISHSMGVGTGAQRVFIFLFSFYLCVLNFNTLHLIQAGQKLTFVVNLFKQF